MKSSTILSFLFISFLGTSQMTQELWLEGNLKYKIDKKQSLSASINSRFYQVNLQLLFPEVSYKYEVLDWMKVSIDYRGLVERNKYANYHYTNRINANVDFAHKIDRLRLGFRVRYQYAFNGFVSSENYIPEFDQAVRFKPSLEYNLNHSKISPTASFEWFYSPVYAVYGKRFTKYRLNLGFNYNLKKGNELSLNYLFGKSINLPKTKSQHILSLSFSHELKRKKKDKSL
jgi:hypothetical protein